jgi:hypothetical protein
MSRSCDQTSQVRISTKGSERDPLVEASLSECSKGLNTSVYEPLSNQRLNVLLRLCKLWHNLSLSAKISSTTCLNPMFLVNTTLFLVDIRLRTNRDIETGLRIGFLTHKESAWSTRQGGVEPTMIII